MSGKAIIFSAPSGSGKTTIVRHLMSEFPVLKFSISATTRSPRTDEEDGKDYYFLSVKDFKNLIVNDEVLEWEEVYQGVYYGTLKSEIQKIWDEGNVAIFDVDVEGGINLKQQLGERALAVFVKVKSLTELENRLRARQSETENTIKQRVEKARTEMQKEDQFDISLVNDDLEATLKQAIQLVSNFID